MEKVRCQNICKATVSMNLVGQYWQKHPQTFQGEKSGKAVFLSN